MKKGNFGTGVMYVVLVLLLVGLAFIVVFNYRANVEQREAIEAAIEAQSVTPTPQPTATPVPTEAPATATPAPTAAGTAAPTATKDPNAAPQTGDETPVMLYATMLTVCAAALTLALIFRRRREK